LKTYKVKARKTLHWCIWASFPTGIYKGSVEQHSERAGITHSLRTSGTPSSRKSARPCDTYFESMLISQIVDRSSTRLGFPPTLFRRHFPTSMTRKYQHRFIRRPHQSIRSARPAPVSVAARRNSRRLVNSFMPASSQRCPVDIRNSEESQTRQSLVQPNSFITEFDQQYTPPAISSRLLF